MVLKRAFLKYMEVLQHELGSSYSIKTAAWSREDFVKENIRIYA
jgi:hypothetical protein